MPSFIERTVQKCQCEHSYFLLVTHTHTKTNNDYHSFHNSDLNSSILLCADK